MPSTWSKITLHVVMSTHDRQPTITPPIRNRLDPFIGGIVRELGGSLYQAGGMPDHSHLLIRIGADRSVADIMRNVKSRSSKWVHETFPESGFAWQKGYGVFSVSESSVDEVRQYIRRQEEHHRTRDFKSELLAMLNLHNVEFDERYVFD